MPPSAIAVMREESTREDKRENMRQTKIGAGEKPTRKNPGKNQSGATRGRPPLATAEAKPAGAVRSATLERSGGIER